MKRIMLILAIGVLCVCLLTGCQGATRSFGGTTKITLEPNTKLELITWKEDSLWYLTRPMRADDIAETHIYQEQAEFGILEGTVVIIETKNED